MLQQADGSYLGIAGDADPLVDVERSGAGGWFWQGEGVPFLIEHDWAQAAGVAFLRADFRLWARIVLAPPGRLAAADRARELIEQGVVGLSLGGFGFGGRPNGAGGRSYLRTLVTEISLAKRPKVSTARLVAEDGSLRAQLETTIRDTVKSAMLDALAAGRRTGAWV